MALEMFPELTRERRLEITRDLHSNIDYKGVRLTAKEVDFMNTVKKYINNDWALTDKQLKWLKDIHEKYVLPNSSEESQEEEEC